jgi:hypothetical protein
MSSARMWGGQDGTVTTARGPARGPMRDIVSGLDAWLRRSQGFVEFSDNPTCMLRVAPCKAETELRLSDGVVVARGAPILDLHFWNERLPQASDCHGLGWGSRFGRQLIRSLEELAAALDHDARLANAVAIRGRLAFAGARNREESRRFGGWFGLEVAEEEGPVPLVQRLHDAGEDLWLLALTYTFNPGSLRRRAVIRRRDDLWISRQRMIARHGPHEKSAAGSARSAAA